MCTVSTRTFFSFIVAAWQKLLAPHRFLLLFFCLVFPSSSLSNWRILSSIIPWLCTFFSLLSSSFFWSLPCLYCLCVYFFLLSRCLPHGVLPVLNYVVCTTQITSSAPVLPFHLFFLNIYISQELTPARFLCNLKFIIYCIKIFKMCCM